MMRGSRLARVQRGRNGHGKQSRAANRASNTMPFLGQVFGRHDMLSLPAGHVTALRSQSTWNAALVSPSSRRACQLGSSATGPMMATPQRCWLPTSTCESV